MACSSFLPLMQKELYIRNVMPIKDHNQFRDCCFIHATAAFSSDTEILSHRTDGLFCLDEKMVEKWQGAA
jgi:hypothetical protein